MPAAVPSGVVLVKGARPGASDSATPVPEGGTVVDGVFSDPYFGMSYALPAQWVENFKGPPPSDSGRYVLAQLKPADRFQGAVRGSILITAQDMFFTPLPAANAAELVSYSREHLPSYYKAETPPALVTVAGRSFIRFAYWSPAAQMHWYVLTTQIRCHAVEIVLTSRDTKLLKSLLADLNKMKLPAEVSPTAGEGGGDMPVCIADYAQGDNVITRVEPVFTAHRFNPVPVRIIIDKDGRVKHIHWISVFPDQEKAITSALGEWRFVPYRRNGQLLEVETGLMFGRAPRPAGPGTAGRTTQ